MKGNEKIPEINDGKCDILLPETYIISLDQKYWYICYIGRGWNDVTLEMQNLSFLCISIVQVLHEIVVKELAMN